MSPVPVPRHIRLLLVCDTYPPVLGGSEIEAQRVSAGMIAAGHEVHVLCAGGPPMPAVREWTDPKGVPVSILTRQSTGRRKDIAFALQVIREIWERRASYDIVYFLMQGLHLAAGLPIARLLRKPVAVKISGSGIFPLLRGSKAGRLELHWMRRWRIPVMVLNEGMMQEALAHGLSREQLVWMPNPVDTDEFRPAIAGEAGKWRRHQGIPANCPALIYVGRLSAEKGLTGLLRSFAIAARQMPQAMLLLVGDGPLRPELERLAAELGLLPEQVRFVGRVDVSNVPAWLRVSDVFALTSPNEGFSCALVEAMSAGLASVVSNIPANLQLVDDGVHGLTVPFDGVEKIGQALLRLFRDPELRSRMGAVAREVVVQKFSTSHVIERYENLFRETIGR